MPSVNARVNLTLPPELHTILVDLATALKKPVSTVVTDLLTEIIPHMEGITKIARAQQAGNVRAAKNALAHMVGNQMADVMATYQPELFGKPRKSKP